MWENTDQKKIPYLDTFHTVLHFGLWKRWLKVKKSQYFKVSHSKKLGYEKTLIFPASINITLPNYYLKVKSCFKLLFCHRVMSNTSHSCQKNILSGHIRSISDVLSVCLVCSSYSNIFNSVEIYVTIYDRRKVYIYL